MIFTTLYRHKSNAHRNMQMFPQQVIGLLCPSVRLEEAARQNNSWHNFNAARPSCSHEHIFFVSLQCQLLAKPVDPTTTENHPQANRKSCGMCMSGYSCCLVSWWGEDRIWSLQHWLLGEGPTLTILLLLLTRKHRSIHNVNIHRKAWGRDLLFSMID